MEIQIDSGNQGLLIVHYLFQISQLSHSVIVTYELNFINEKIYITVKEIEKELDFKH